jgi:hypothetical protein
MSDFRPRRRLVAAALVACLAFGPWLTVAASAKTPTIAQVTALVKAAVKITSIPTNLSPPLTRASTDWPSFLDHQLDRCIADGTTLTLPCVFGDPHGTRTMVLWGDSHAEMWFPALNAVATRLKWRLVVLIELGCPYASIEVPNIGTGPVTPNTTCVQFRQNMIARINAADPQLVVLSEAYFAETGSGQTVSPTMWQAAVTTTLSALDSAGTKVAIIGNDVTVPGVPQCLAANPTNVQVCNGPDSTVFVQQRAAEQTAAKAAQDLYVDEVPWECSSTCTQIVGHELVYFDSGHISDSYSLFLSGALQAALTKDLLKHH